MILEWGEPPKKEDPDVRAEYWGGGIPGAYAPNMDAGWMARWKAKMTGQRGAVLTVEIRKTVCMTPRPRSWKEDARFPASASGNAATAGMVTGGTRTTQAASGQ